jgi:hypothetical protein
MRYPDLAELLSDSIAVEHGEENKDSADASEREKFPVLTVTEKWTPNGKHHRAERPSHGRDKQKRSVCYAAKAEQITPLVLGNPGMMNSRKAIIALCVSSHNHTAGRFLG